MRKKEKKLELQGDLRGGKEKKLDKLKLKLNQQQSKNLKLLNRRINKNLRSNKKQIRNQNKKIPNQQKKKRRQWRIQAQ